MLRLVVFICFLQFSVGQIIHGHVMLSGDATKFVRLPANSNLTVIFQDTSLADASAIVLKEKQYTDVESLPLFFIMEISDDFSPSLSASYSLAARVTKGDDLLFINDQRIPVKLEDKKSLTIDIPVISVQQNEDDTQDSSSSSSSEEQTETAWPEMLGKEGTYAVEYIKEKTGLTNVFTILENSPMTMDYRTDRVRIVVNEEGFVSQVPHIG